MNCCLSVTYFLFIFTPGQGWYKNYLIQSTYKDFPPPNPSSVKNQKLAILNQGLPSQSCYHQIWARILHYPASISTGKRLSCLSRKIWQDSPSRQTRACNQVASLCGARLWLLRPFHLVQVPHKLRGSGPRCTGCRSVATRAPVTAPPIRASGFQTDCWVRSTRPVVWTLDSTASPGCPYQFIQGDYVDSTAQGSRI